MSLDLSKVDIAYKELTVKESVLKDLPYDLVIAIDRIFRFYYSSKSKYAYISSYFLLERAIERSNFNYDKNYDHLELKEADENFHSKIFPNEQFKTYEVLSFKHLREDEILVSIKVSIGKYSEIWHMKFLELEKDFWILVSQCYSFEGIIDHCEYSPEHDFTLVYVALTGDKKETIMLASKGDVLQNKIFFGDKVSVLCHVDWNNPSNQIKGYYIDEIKKDENYSPFVFYKKGVNTLV